MAGQTVRVVPRSAAKERYGVLVFLALVVIPLSMSNSTVAQTTAPAAKPSTTTQPMLNKSQFSKLYRTWVTTGFFNEIDQTGHTDVTINEPVVMRFRWGTNAPGAEEGSWRLRGRPLQQGSGQGSTSGFQKAPSKTPKLKKQIKTPGASNLNLTVLATGVATDAPGGQFEIDLAPHLPATPPSVAMIYYLDVVARKQATFTTTKGTSAGGSGAKVSVPARDVGVWSTPVVITYVRNTSTPQQFTIGDVYRKITFVLDKFILVKDQYGPGDEEYHLRGIIQELRQRCAGPAQQDCRFTSPLAQRTFRYYRVVDPPDAAHSPREIDMGHVFDRDANPPLKKVENSWDFPMGMGTNKVMGPRRYAVGISILEEDGGSALQVWSDGVNELAEEILDGNVLDLGADQLDDYIEEHVYGSIQYVADGVRMFAEAARDSSQAVPIIGAAIAIFTPIIGCIDADADDDYYGTGGAQITLLSNRVNVAHSMPGQLVTANGHQQYITTPEKIRFKGPPPCNAAAAFDGIVDLEFHWEFSDREQE